MLLVAFMAFEVGSAIYSHSLALLADAGHMLIDVGAIAGSLVALRLAARPETRSHTYGLKRAEILAAAFNGISLIVVAALVTFEAIVRLLNPSPVDGAVLIVVASVGVAVNLLATLVMSRANRESLNVEGAYRHILTDLYGFIGTVIAGIVIVTSGFERADAIASLLVVVLMLKASVELLRPALRILLEATPDDIDLEEVREHLLGAARGGVGARPARLDPDLVTPHPHGARRGDRRVPEHRTGRARARSSPGLPVRPLRRGPLDAAVRDGGAYRARVGEPPLTLLAA